MSRLKFPDYAVRYDRSPLLEHTGGVLRPGGLELTARLITLACLKPGQRLLDLACGAGVSSGCLAGTLGLDVLGVDISLPLLRNARQRSARPLFCQAGAASLPLCDGAVDAVLCECALSLFPEPDIVLAEVRRVLRPGGMLLLSDLYAREAVPEEGSGPCRCCVDGARSRGELLLMLARKGLEVHFFEDNTKHLKQLAGELIFAHGSLEAFWHELLPGGCASSATRRASQARLGYYVLVAKKI